ncbi:AraC family transcriptional regulator [Paenibacillus marinisediminis]
MDDFISDLRNKQVVFEYSYLERPLKLGHMILNQAMDVCLIDEMKGHPLKKSEYLLIYMVSGAGVLSVGDEEWVVNEQEYILVDAPSKWRLINSNTFSPMRILTLYIQDKWMSPIEMEIVDSMHSSVERPLQGKDTGMLYDQLVELLKELANEDLFAPAMAESLLRQIIIRICRAEQSLPDQQGTDISPSIDSKKELIYQMIRYMDDHNLKTKELKHMSEILGYSYSHLSHVFREEMGETLQTYWARKRTLQAKKLLEAGQLSITKIAETLHYQSIHSFSKAFKKSVGVTPSEYQEQFRACEKQSVLM